MAFYLVRAHPKPDLIEELWMRLEQQGFLTMQPFGRSLTKGLEGARRDPETGEAVWEEEDYCSPPLAMEREAVLDRYFDDLRVERVQEGEGWQQIAGLPSLWEQPAALPDEAPIALPAPGADPAACLEPTDVIDSAHSHIVETAGRLTRGLETPFERAVAVFNFVRDSVGYNFAPDLLSRDDWRASETLARGDGFCQQKAVLLAALARAAGIPSAIGFQHLRDYKLLDTRYAAAIPDGLIPLHGLTYLWLDGAWRIADATLDAELCTRRRYRLVELVRGAHARLPATDLDGKPHFDILTEVGPFPDLPESVSTFMVSLRPAWLALREVVRRTGATM